MSATSEPVGGHGAAAAHSGSEARFRDMADHAPVMTWVTDPSGSCIYLNSRWYEFTGQTPEQAEGFGWLDAVHPDDRAWSGEMFLRASARHESFHLEYRLRRADGVYRWALDTAAPRFSEDGAFLGHIGSVIDIDERRGAEAALQDLNETLERRVAERTSELEASERRFRGIFDSALQFMALLSPDGTVIEVNRTALEWSRIEPADIVGRPFWLAAPMRDNPALQAAIRAGIRRAAAGETVREEHEMRGAGETRAVVDFSLKPVAGGQDGPAWLVAEGRDITDLKHAQDALRQAQKLEAVGQLTGGVAHDFNNMLTIIKSSTDLLRRPDLPEERRRRYVDAISETVDRAARLTGQLLAFARRQALKPVRFDPAERIRAITDMLRAIVGSRIAIDTDEACRDCLVEADANQFETAIVNLVVNARDAMEGEGRLTIRVASDETMPPIRGHLGGPGRFAAVSLSDTGIGIPEERLSQIFEPFFTTKEVGKGTGLGLSQVYGFAKQSGGDIAVESRVGRGATFTLYLPLVTGTAAEAGDPALLDLPASPDGGGRRVLVVEDNEEVGAFSTQVLQDLGYAIAWAAHAEEALALLAGGGFDAVFTDVVMPGMSGIELGHEIHRRHPGLPVVLTSGYSHVLAQEGRHGFELIQKPYAAEDLSRVLRRVMQGGGGRQAV